MNDWYYWTRNQYAHHIVFRNSEDRVATGSIKQIDDKTFQYKVNGPCWSTFEADGVRNSLEEAKQAVNRYVDMVIAEEFKPEYVPPLG